MTLLAESNPTHSVLDPRTLAELWALADDGDASFIHQLFESFLSAASDLSSEIAQAVADGQEEALRQAAHSLKGSASNVGAHTVAQICMDLESVDDIASAGGLATSLEREIVRVRQAMAAEIPDHALA